MLSPKESLIIGLLAERGEMYGLELVAASDQELKRGTVYVTLARMEEKGYVVARAPKPNPHEPGLARQLSIDLPRGDSAAEEHYRCVHRWIHAHRGHRQQEEMALRKSLQLQHPVLFWMLKRSVA